MNKNRTDLFSQKETQQRFEAALRGARIAGHKPKEDMPKNSGESRGRKPNGAKPKHQR